MNAGDFPDYPTITLGEQNYFVHGLRDGDAARLDRLTEAVNRLAAILERGGEAD